MRLLRLFSLAASAVLVLGLVSAAHAATISAGTATPVANGGTAPGSATNYDFGDFGNNGQPIVLTDYTVSTAGDNQYPGNGNYTSLFAPDGTGPFTTGIAYIGGADPVVATFSPNSNGDFSVWILDANTDGINVGNTFVGLGVNGGGEVDTATMYQGLNEFTRYDVTGALSTDVFQVYATKTDINTWASLGGVTFSDITPSASPVPEPSSLMLIGTGLLGGLATLRRKFKA